MCVQLYYMNEGFYVVNNIKNLVNENWLFKKNSNCCKKA